MKFVIIFLLSLFSVNCQESKKINFPDGDKILYSEFTGRESQRLVLYSLEEQKEYEIPLSSFKKFPLGAKFSPDGKMILLKGANYIDDFYIFDLATSEWQQKRLPFLKQADERDYFFFNYLDDSTIAVKGLYNLFIISLNTSELIDRIVFKDKFVSSIAVNPSENILFINYSLVNAKAPFIEDKLHLKLYDYKKRKYIKQFDNTEDLEQWIEGTNKLYMIEETAVSFNLETGEKIPLKFEHIKADTIIYSNSRFIDQDRFLVLMKGSNHFENDFYIYDFRDNSIRQVTNTKSWKSLKDFFIK